MTGKIDDIFQLDSYQLVVQLFNEALIFTMLSSVVFNIFGIAQPVLVSCGSTLLNGSCTAYDAISECSAPNVSYEFVSASVEFGEYCSRHELTWFDSILAPMGIMNKPRFSTTVQMLGVIVGSGLSGTLSDRYGRRKTTLCFLVGMFVCTLTLSFAPNIDFYVITRFFIGVCGGSLTTVGCIYVVENLPTSHRFWMSTVITWAPNYILFAGVAYLCGEWRLLARVCSMFHFTALLILFFWLPESPKFLVGAHRKEEAVKSLKYINSFKRASDKWSDERIVAVVEASCELLEGRTKPKKYSLLHLYTASSTIALRTIILSFAMFALSFVTYGLIFNLHVIRGSIYLNTAISGVIRYAVGAVTAVLDHFGGKRVGRKHMHFITMSTVMVCMAIAFAIKFTGSSIEYATALRYFTLLAFGTTGCLFLQYLLVTAELFPTGIRNIASSHINVCGRFGNVLGPMTFTMVTSSFAGLPYLILTALCLADVVLFQVFIPETKGEALPSEMPPKKNKKTVANLENVSPLMETPKA